MHILVIRKSNCQLPSRFYTQVKIVIRLFGHTSLFNIEAQIDVNGISYFFQRIILKNNNMIKKLLL
ncbi:hypothetical protein D3C73_536690 [compost metagenome]